MSYTNIYYLITTILIIITTLYLLNIPRIAFSFEVDTELDYRCLSSNKAFNSNYKANLESLVITLTNNTLSSGYSFSIKSGDANIADDWVYGHVLCRGNISGVECYKCVENAASTVINTHCPNNRSAIIWHDHCMLKYSDEDFFGKLDTGYNLTMCSANDLYLGYETVPSFLDDLIRHAMITPMMFYNRSWLPQINPLGVNVTLYGLVQCTLDISRDDCKTCLHQAEQGLSECSQTKEGGRVVYGSCNVRYEKYDFITS